MVSGIHWEWEFLLQTIKLGIGIAICYDGLRIFRTIFSHPAFLTSLEDLLFWIFCTASIFRLQFYQNNGVSRGFSILGIMFGMLVYDKMIGERLVAAAGKLIHFIKRQLTGIGKMFKMTLCKHKKFPVHNRSHYGKKKNQSSEEETESGGNDTGTDSSYSDDAGGCLQ